MKITATKVKRELISNYGYIHFSMHDEQVIKDVLKVIGEILVRQKGISIK